MHEKPEDILDRKSEWAELIELAESDRAELVFMQGRRRVGKSWILQRFADAADAIYYQGSSPKICGLLPSDRHPKPLHSAASGCTSDSLSSERFHVLNSSIFRYFRRVDHAS